MYNLMEIKFLPFFVTPSSVSYTHLTTGILASDVVKATKNDKKMDSGVIKFITLEENGHAIIDRTISEELLLEATETVIRG